MTDPAPLMLSVSGARGIVGATMTEEVVAGFAARGGSIFVGASAAAPAFGLGRSECGPPAY